MQIVIDRIESAARKLSVDNDELCRSGAFEDLVAQLGLKISMNQAKHEAENPTELDVLRQFRFIQHDVWSIETLCERLEWQRGLWNSGEIDGSKWSRFATADIILFHMEYRSIFDYVARILALLSNKPGQVSAAKPRNRNDVISFERMSRKANQPMFAAKFGADIAELFQKCDWFRQLRDIRNLISHYGGDTFVYEDKPEILFQVHDSRECYDRKVTLPGVMYNENVARFDLYAGVFYGYLLWYLDEAAPVIAGQLHLDVIHDRSKSCHPGICVMQSWMSKALDAVSHATNPDE